MSLTDWFHSSIDPVHPGVYLTTASDTIDSWQNWRKWDGKHWHYGEIATIDGTSYVASPPQDRPTFILGPFVRENGFYWRGIKK